MHQVIAFQCGFCSKVNTNKHYINRHEKSCHWNPATRSCATCICGLDGNGCTVRGTELNSDLRENCPSWEIHPDHNEE